MRHAQRQEEPPDLRFQPRAAGHRGAQPAAEAGADLGAHQPVQQRIGQPVAAMTARSPSTRLHAERHGARGTAPAASGFCRATWASTRARITSSTRGTAVMMVGRTVSMSAARCSTPRAIDDLGADAGQEELPDGVLEAVRERQVGQVDLVLQPQRTHQFEGAPAVRQDRSGAAASRPSARRRCRRCRSGRPAHRAGSPPPRRRCRPAARRRATRAAQGSDARRPLGAVGGRPSPPAGRGRRSRRPARSRSARAAVETIAARGAAVAQDVGVIVDGVGGVGRHRHGADRHQRGLGDRVFRPVLGTDQHPVAGRHAGGAQAAARRTAACGRIRPRSCRARRRRGTPAASACSARCAPGEHHRGQIRPGRVALHVSSSARPSRAAAWRKPFDVPRRASPTP